MSVRYVIFDLDDTLVHSAAVRRAFADVAAEHGIGAAQVEEACDTLPGRPAREIFAALGLGEQAAQEAAARFVALLEALNEELPTVPYPDAGETLRAVRERGVQMFLSTGSPDERARRVLEAEGWEGFELVLGSGPQRRKGAEHFRVLREHLAGAEWAAEAATVGDSPEDMRLGAQHGVPVRIGLARRADARAELRRAGATHVVRSLADIVPILAAA